MDFFFLTTNSAQFSDYYSISFTFFVRWFLLFSLPVVLFIFVFSIPTNDIKFPIDHRYHISTSIYVCSHTCTHTL